jgi:hypothetical protein
MLKKHVPFSPVMYAFDQGSYVAVHFKPAFFRHQSYSARCMPEPGGNAVDLKLYGAVLQTRSDKTHSAVTNLGG